MKNWLDGCRKRVVVNGSVFRWKPVMNGIPLWSILGLILFINNLDSGIKCVPSNFTDDTKLTSEVDIRQGRDATHRDLDRLKKWARKNLGRFNKDKVLYFGLGAIPDVRTEWEKRLGGCFQPNHAVILKEV